jgi:hypothetical protein
MLDWYEMFGKLVNLTLDGLDDNSIQMSQHRRDLFDAIYREYNGSDY